MIVASLGFMIWISWQLTLVVAFTVILMGIGNVCISKGRIRRTDSIKKMKTELCSIARKGFLVELSELVGYHTTVNKFDEHSQKMYYKSKRSAILFGIGEFFLFIYGFAVRPFLIYYV